MLVDEFWAFFEELFSAPELKGLGELSLDMTRLVLKTYEPMLVEVLNLLKAGRRFNQWQVQELMKRAGTVRSDLVIMRRQIRALRYIKPFFQADPKDFSAQAKIIAEMVREFGPFFVKMAQVAAANADFLPEEIAEELAVFHEDVPPMSEQEVNQAFIECYGKLPTQLYLGFDAAKPLKSGSIGSVFLAKKPFIQDGKEVLEEVVVKVGRHNLDREFAIGKLVLGLGILSSQYWAPHSKLAPFLRAMLEQVDEFIAGFMQELDFGDEAKNQERFRQRSFETRSWRVPALYSSTPRILEMEFLSDAESLSKSLERMPAKKRRQFQTEIAERLLYAVLQQLFLYQEIHGDLHPGNIMVGKQGDLYLIDWGSTVSLQGKWGAVWDYLAAAMTADVDALTDSLIKVSTEPNVSPERRDEIRTLLSDTLKKKGVDQLTGKVLLSEIRSGREIAIKNLHKRAQTVLQVMSNTQQAGLVLRRDYLLLSRGIMAAVGSFSSLYEDSPKRFLARDLARGFARAPVTFTKEKISLRVSEARDTLARVTGQKFLAANGPDRLRRANITDAVNLFGSHTPALSAVSEPLDSKSKKGKKVATRELTELASKKPPAPAKPSKKTKKTKN